jgi:hypothetical protein
LLIMSVQAQIFEDQSKLQVGYQRGLFLGNESFNSRGTIAPSFYANFKTAEGIVVTQTNRLTDRFSLGFGVGYLSIQDWQSPNHDSYNGSRVTIYSLQPVFQYHTPYREAGMYKRLKLYGELAPAIGYETDNLSNYPFEIVGIGYKKYVFQESKKITLGYQATLGSEFALTNTIGLFLNIHFRESFTNSPYYVDTHYSILGVSVGTSFSLSKIKRFNY